MPGRRITESAIEGKKTGRHRIQHYIREGRRCRMQKEDDRRWPVLERTALHTVFLSSARAHPKPGRGCAWRQEGMTTSSGAMRAPTMSTARTTCTGQARGAWMPAEAQALTAPRLLDS